MYKEGFGCGPLQTKQCEDNEYLSQIQTDASGKITQYKCCTDDSKLMQGAPGPKGDEGAAGKDGTNGATGPAGLAGPAGPAGSKGPIGDTGDKGKIGEKGLPGKPGPKGPPGEPGNNGIVESSGKAVGDPIPGPKGPTGNMGPKGPVGPKGNDAPPIVNPITQGPQTGSEKLKEIQLKLIKALSARTPPITQHVIFHEDEMDDGQEEMDEEEIIEFTPSEAQGNEYSKATYKQY